MNSPSAILWCLLVPAFVLAVIVWAYTDRVIRQAPGTQICRCHHGIDVHQHSTRRRDTRCGLCDCWEYIQRDVAYVRALEPVDPDDVLLDAFDTLPDLGQVDWPAYERDVRS